MTAVRKLVWIDLDNSPHVPFFRPIVEELKRNGYTIFLTARDAFQVTDLARLHNMECTTIGRHFGKNSMMKALGLLARAIQLLPAIVRNKPDLAISHGSRAQLMAARLAGIPTLVIADYEHVTHVNRADYILVPEVIPAEVVSRFAKNVLKYPGIKEDVYAATFKPDPSIVNLLELKSNELLVTIRPPATEAHYHNPESEALFGKVIDLLAQTDNARMVLLPRNKRQEHQITMQWPKLIQDGKILIPGQAVDGLNLVWHSDLVISGGGTMNREAAALGIPVYSIFRGSIGAVDQYLVDTGRLVLLKTIEEIDAKLLLVKRNRTNTRPLPARSTLDKIVHEIGEALESTHSSALASHNYRAEI